MLYVSDGYWRGFCIVLGRGIGVDVLTFVVEAVGVVFWVFVDSFFGCFFRLAAWAGR